MWVSLSVICSSLIFNKSFLPIMKKIFIALTVISVMTIWGAYRLSSNHQAYFETVETLYETGQAVNLDNSLTADQLSSLLYNRGYIDKKGDCNFLAVFVVDSILKKRGKIPNLGELNQLKNYVPEAIIDSTGRCTYLSTRLEEMHRNLGLDAEAQECYLTHRTITSNGEGTVRLEVDIENDKNLSAPVNDILVRLRRHTVDSLSQGENVETIACQWTDAQGKVVFHVDDKSFYSVIPIKQGYEYGVPKGTRDGVPFSKDTRLTFKQRLNKIKVFDSYTYRNIKDDNLLCLDAAKNGTKFWQFYLADTCQMVEYLLLFELQLFVVGQILPFTTTADTEMLTEGSRAYITIFYKAHHLALGK